MFLNIWPSLAFIGLYWPFWPLMAFNDFFRTREVFMGINQVKMSTFHPSDNKNGHHTRFTKAVHSVSISKLLRSTPLDSRVHHNG